MVCILSAHMDRKKKQGSKTLELSWVDHHFPEFFSYSNMIRGLYSKILLNSCVAAFSCFEKSVEIILAHSRGYPICRSLATGFGLEPPMNNGVGFSLSMLLRPSGKAPQIKTEYNNILYKLTCLFGKGNEGTKNFAMNRLKSVPSLCLAGCSLE